jgi:hypothetical protein
MWELVVVSDEVMEMAVGAASGLGVEVETGMCSRDRWRILSALPLLMLIVSTSIAGVQDHRPRPRQLWTTSFESSESDELLLLLVRSG